jgi:hypothetical protein
VLEFLTIYGVPLADEHGAVIVAYHFRVPGKAAGTGVNLVRIAVLVLGRQVDRADRRTECDVAPSLPGALHETSMTPDSLTVEQQVQPRNTS